MIFSQVGSNQGACDTQQVALPFNAKMGPINGSCASQEYPTQECWCRDCKNKTPNCPSYSHFRSNSGESKGEKGVSQFVKALSKMSKILPPRIELAMGAFFWEWMSYSW